jgi:hypothetical protein
VALSIVILVSDDQETRLGELVDVRTFIAEKAAERFPPKLSGRRGRPSGGGLARVAEAMGVSPSRLSGIIREAEVAGQLGEHHWLRIAKGLGVGSARLLRQHDEWKAARWRGGKKGT